MGGFFFLKFPHIPKASDINCIWKHFTALNNAGSQLLAFLTQSHWVALQQENKKEQPCSEILFPKLQWMNQMEESRNVMKELRHRKGKGSLLLLFCNHSKPRSPDMGLFIHCWKYLCSALHNVNLVKTTAASGSLIKLPFCAMGRPMSIWEADDGKPEATTYMPYFTLTLVCPVTMKAYRDLN